MLPRYMPIRYRVMPLCRRATSELISGGKCANYAFPRPLSRLSHAVQSRLLHTHVRALVCAQSVCACAMRAWVWGAKLGRLLWRALSCAGLWQCSAACSGAVCRASGTLVHGRPRKNRIIEIDMSGLCYMEQYHPRVPGYHNTRVIEYLLLQIY